MALLTVCAHCGVAVTRCVVRRCYCCRLAWRGVALRGVVWCGGAAGCSVASAALLPALLSALPTLLLLCLLLGRPREYVASSVRLAHVLSVPPRVPPVATRRTPLSRACCRVSRGAALRFCCGCSGRDAGFSARPSRTILPRPGSDCRAGMWSRAAACATATLCCSALYPVAAQLVLGCAHIALACCPRPPWAWPPR